jgi:hypothetical protein
MAIYFPNQNIQEISGKLSPSGGTVVQVVESRTTSTVACANWSTQNFLFNGTITPTKSTNKILVYVYLPFRMDAGVGSWSLGYAWVKNNAGSDIMVSGWDGTWRQTISSWEKQYLDSPGSTSTQTYSVYVGNYPSGTCYHNNSSVQGSDGYAYLRMTEISV